MKFTQLQFKRGTTSEWATANPILASGEPGFDYSVNTLKVGDGVNPWSVLPGIQADPATATELSGDTTPELGGNLDLSGYNITGSGNVHIQGSGYVQLPLLQNGEKPAHTEGIVYYDEDSHALSYYNEVSDVTINIGQELVTRVRNNTGSTILNGQPVYIDGAHGAVAPTAALANADNVSTSHVAGLATHDIANNSFGYVTVHGLVRDMDTSSFSEGEELYLAASGDGILTNVAPVIPNFKVGVAQVIRSHASEGTLLVELSAGKLGGGDMKSEPSPVVSGVPFVEQLSNDGGSASLKCDTLFTYDESNSKLDVQKTKTNVVMRAYANLATVPSPETWMVVFSTTDNLPVWYDGANWKDFAGNIV